MQPVGQAVADMISGISHASGFLGGASAGVRELVRRLGVKGLDAGLGCGVGVGYGFGAGLFLKPSVAEQLSRLVEGAAGNMVHFGQARLQEMGVQLPGGSHLLRNASNTLPQPRYFEGAAATGQSPLLSPQGAPQPPGGDSNAGGGRAPDLTLPLSPQSSPWPGAAAGPLGPAWDPATQLDPSQHQQTLQSHGFVQPVLQMELGTSDRLPHAHQDAMPPSTQGPVHHTSIAPLVSSSTGAGRCTGPSGPAREPSAEEFRALLRHERQIARLRAQNRALRSAVCRLDRRYNPAFSRRLMGPSLAAA
ncbi:hypothetical protein VOLCADRAFT_90196 [Volvox carteri f. nagariensis]|uniref:Uncharacterized protein n=1 Tax=Volvox carteri f. nagariensis TaxID=3068 RepID=D8TTR1_VOLCA|nr:uncharacterized protein VOLCADRAFT_90196 [Volvox carteri f. nagariensis]EFJ49354.1 hypothetical protein VOLCADRAFT_90196 [Volvox carteri f. nagariensis]|eukprot:XP_002949802.1 hypothetical protein VOLCADRAFT_90196 [Volvox carteri f. nagariensis]